MKKLIALGTVTLFLIGGIVNPAYAENNIADQNHVFYTPKDIVWNDGPASLPKGAKVAVLEGDPKNAGPFTIRLKFPANFKVGPHYHPATEHVTVISGVLYLGTGDKFDSKQAKALPANSFAYMEPNVHHFGFTQGETIIQLHGTGPWKIVYLNPEEDPQNQQ